MKGGIGWNLKHFSNISSIWCLSSREIDIIWCQIYTKTHTPLKLYPISFYLNSSFKMRQFLQISVNRRFFCLSCNLLYFVILVFSTLGSTLLPIVKACRYKHKVFHFCFKLWQTQGTYHLEKSPPPSSPHFENLYLRKLGMLRLFKGFFSRYSNK